MYQSQRIILAKTCLHFSVVVLITGFPTLDLANGDRIIFFFKFGVSQSEITSLQSHQSARLRKRTHSQRGALARNANKHKERGIRGREEIDLTGRTNLRHKQ
jgi:hypothetical protein